MNENGAINFIFEHAREHWLAGKCPCCGGYLVSWPGPDGTEYDSGAVAEGVMFCGRCIGNEHHQLPGYPLNFLDLLLRAIAEGL